MKRWLLLIACVAFLGCRQQPPRQSPSVFRGQRLDNVLSIAPSTTRFQVVEKKTDPVFTVTGYLSISGVSTPTTTKVAVKTVYRSRVKDYKFVEDKR